LSEDELEESDDIFEFDDLSERHPDEDAALDVSDEEPEPLDVGDEEPDPLDDDEPEPLDADEGGLEAKLVAGIEAMAAAMGVDVEVSGGEEGEAMEEPMEEPEPAPMDAEEGEPPMGMQGADEPDDEDRELAMEGFVNRIAARVAKRILNESK
jgi:hypothetical protein